MDKKIALLTLWWDKNFWDMNYLNANYWNKLQNYAVQEILKKYIEWEIITIKNSESIHIGFHIIAWIKYLFKESKKKWIYKAFFFFIKKSFATIIRLKKSNNTAIHQNKNKLELRNGNFIKFENYLRMSDFIIDVYRPNKKLLEWFTYYVVWSDQVRNPSIKRKIKPLFTLWFINSTKKIAFSASFWIDKLSKWNLKRIKEISKFKAISVRETKWKEIIEEYTDRKDVQVLLDPTMLLPIESRNKISICPPQFKESWFENNKYIFCYFLWNIGEKVKSEIERIAKEKKCKIIYIMDINDPFFTCWPSEFIWLIRNSYLVCTDSFHWSAFSLLYNKPFVVFNRIDPWQKEWEKNSMNSRLVTLLEKFQIKNRYFNWKIDNELLMADYPQFENILKQEKIKADEFLKQAFSE